MGILSTEHIYIFHFFMLFLSSGSETTNKNRHMSLLLPLIAIYVVIKSDLFSLKSVTLLCR